VPHSAAATEKLTPAGGFVNVEKLLPWPAARRPRVTTGC